VLALGLVILLVIELQPGRMAPEDIIVSLGRWFRDGNTAEALRFCQQRENSCFLTRVFGTALARVSRSPYGTLELRNALEEGGRREVERLYRTTDLVGIVSQVGPMLGLLGTVTGMIATFDLITEFGTSDPKLLSGGISEALITTELGLIVAIPALLLGNTLSTWARGTYGELTRAALHINNLGLLRHDE
jgi:biopolymer transport protein ExbB